jgi:hypothetical protein
VRGVFGVQSANWLAGGIHFGILAIAVQFHTLAVSPYALGAMSLISFAAWISNYRRLRQISDTPTSNIASAAQGYAEITGRAEQPGGTPLLSKLTNLPCVWFRYEVYEKSADDNWSLEESGDSDQPFVVKDATGQCVIDPEGAEVICARKQTWTEGSRRYTEWLLLPQERVYAIGDFVTIGGPDSELDSDADISAQLTEWKKNQPELLRRFDLNRDGAIDLKEWELARRQARREVEAEHREIRMRDGTHVLRKPADGRLFLLSNYVPEKLRQTYLIWSWVHTVIFVGAGGFALVLLK